MYSELHRAGQGAGEGGLGVDVIMVSCVCLHLL